MLVILAEKDLTARWAIESSDETQQGAFAATAASNDGYKLAGWNVKVQAAQNDPLAK
jgi:hypothetical protein